MTVDLTQLVLLGVYTTALHWLIARSEIARPLWSRASGWLEKLLRCPACSGYWLGGLVTWCGVQPFGDAGWVVGSWWTFFVKTQLAGLAAMVLTPIFEGIMVWGLHASAISDDGDVIVTTGVDPDPLTESGEITPNERPRS